MWPYIALRKHFVTSGLFLNRGSSTSNTQAISAAGKCFQAPSKMMTNIFQLSHSFAEWIIQVNESNNKTHWCISGTCWILWSVIWFEVNIIRDTRWISHCFVFLNYTPFLTEDILHFVSLNFLTANNGASHNQFSHITPKVPFKSCKMKADKLKLNAIYIWRWLSISL